MGRLTRSFEFCAMIFGILNVGAMAMASIELMKAANSTSDQLIAYFVYVVFWIALLGYATIGRNDNKPLAWSMITSTIATGLALALVIAYR